MIQTMRVMTWNILRFENWAQRQSAIEVVIRETDPDVILLQEVATSEKQSEHLAESLGYHEFHTATTDPSSAHMGNAIVSRWPLRNPLDVRLPGADGRPAYRSLLVADVDTPWGSWPVACTHLDHRFDDSELRRRQVDAIADVVADRRGDPVKDRPLILGGDFNAVPDSDEIRRLTGRTPTRQRGLVFNDVWEQVGSGAGWTWSSDNPMLAEANWPNRRLDYLFVTWPRPKSVGRPVAVRLAGVGTIGGIQPSDHYAVVADLRV
ncbi:MAG: hypothetical protein RL391_519 [Actinomycetota bacterium]|jgi:endonuclease/exonuclease/phosphatase family metal-dependent hydrolase